MTVMPESGSTLIRNTSGIHRHAHLVFPAKLSGDFTFTIELMGGYELGFLNRAGKDEMLYIELGEAKKFEAFELSRKGTRFEIKRNGRTRPLVHFRFDYGEEFMITLAIKDKESARIKSYKFTDETPWTGTPRGSPNPGRFKRRFLRSDRTHGTYRTEL